MIDTPFCKEHPKNQEDVARRKRSGEKRQESGSGKSSTDSVNSGYGTDYQICIPLGWASPW
jgi:hypothetical protein